MVFANVSVKAYVSYVLSITYSTPDENKLISKKDAVGLDVKAGTTNPPGIGGVNAGNPTNSI
jgi:hypothetical protein